MTTTIAFAAIGLTLLSAIALHLPIRGNSLRDRIRPVTDAPHLGLRITPARRNKLSSADIIALVNEAPFPISWVAIHEVHATPNNEIAHRYRAIASSSGVSNSPWMHLTVSLTQPPGDAHHCNHPTHPHQEAITDFLHHRLALLGLRARPLSEEELELTAEYAPHVLLRQPAGRNHTRRPHLWFTPNKSVDIPPPPRHIVGVGSGGRVLTIRLSEFQQVYVSGLPGHTATRAHPSRASTEDHNPLADLILPALVVGYRVGIYTHRPAIFSALIDAGATLLQHHRCPTVDVVIVDDLTPPSPHDTFPPHAAPPTIVELISTNAHCNVEKRPLHAPQLELGQHQWTLTLDGHSTGVRPITVQAAPRAAANHPARADSTPAVLR